MANPQEHDSHVLIDQTGAINEPALQNGEVLQERESPSEEAQSQEGYAHEAKDEEVEEVDEDDTTRLAKLTARMRDQDDLERDIGRQADQMLVDQADERDNKRLEKTLQEKEYDTLLLWILLYRYAYQ